MHRHHHHSRRRGSPIIIQPPVPTMISDVENEQSQDVPEPKIIGPLVTPPTESLGLVNDPEPAEDWDDIPTQPAATATVYPEEYTHGVYRSPSPQSYSRYSSDSRSNDNAIYYGGGGYDSYSSTRRYRQICRSRKDRERTLRGQTRIGTRPWRRCWRSVKEHDRDTVQGWKEDIDTLLVFAGLFSAVLTAFLVESYKLLQPDPEEKSANLLQRISDRMEGASTTEEPFPQTPLNFAVRINTLWFSSLVFSLAAASIGILVKQWLRAFVSNSASAARDSVRIRAFRHQGLQKWYIPHIIALLPILLQFALTLFFVGLLDLLWSLNTIVAAVLTCFVSASLSFLVVTTILPSICPDSPHRSPQALAVYFVFQTLFRLSVKLLTLFFAPRFLSRPWPIYLPGDPFSRRWRRLRGWLIYVQCRPIQNWRERERFMIARPPREAHLDRLFLAEADVLFMDDHFLEDVIRPCLRHVECPDAARCLTDILTYRAHIEYNGEPSWKSFGVGDKGMFTLFQMVIDTIHRLESADEAEVLKMMDKLDRLCRVAPFEVEDYDVDDIQYRAYELFASLLVRGGRIGRKAFALMSTIHHRAGSPAVSPLVVEDVISYARGRRDQGEIDEFFSACAMALAFARELPMRDLDSLHSKLEQLLEELKQHIQSPDAPSSPIRPSWTLLAELVNFAEDNSEGDLARPELLKLLVQHTFSEPSNAHYSGAQSQELFERASAILRRMYRPPRRRSALLPVRRLEALGLRLPHGRPSSPRIEEVEEIPRDPRQSSPS